MSLFEKKICAYLKKKYIYKTIYCYVFNDQKNTVQKRGHLK